jgi:hypothetical protein
MKALLILALLAVPSLALGQAPASADAPVIRTTVRPAEGIVIGQGVAIDVAVLFRSEMIHPPLVSLPEVGGAQIFRFSSQGYTIRDRIDGQDYIGQSFEFTLYPRRGGTITVPGAKVRLLDRGGEPLGSANGTSSQIEVVVPPGVDASGPVLVSNKVEASQDWSPDPATAKFRVGDAIVRTIRRRADAVPALGMAEFAFAAPQGVRVYVDKPIIEDQINRGSVEGHRTDKVTYVFEKPGSFELPELSQPWWNLSNKQAGTEVLSGVSATVSAMSTSNAHRLNTNSLALALLTITILVVAGGLAFLLRWKPHRKDYRASAAFARKRFLAVAGKADPIETYKALREWRGRLKPAEAGALESDPAFTRLHQQLLATIFSGTENWTRRDGRALSQAAAAWRNGSHRDDEPDALPPLNPIDRRPANHLQPERGRP